MSLQKYSLLPMYMEASEIAPLIEEILDGANNDATIAKIDVAEALLEMLARHNNNHGKQPLSQGLLKRLQNWVVNSWDTSSRDLIDILSTIMVNIDSFSEGISLLESALQDPNPDIRAIAEEALADIAEKEARAKMITA